MLQKKQEMQPLEVFWEKYVFLKIAALTVAIGETPLRILEIYLLRGSFFSKASSFLPDV